MKPIWYWTGRRNITALFLFICSAHTIAQNTPTTRTWQSLLDSLQRDQHVQGILVHVEAPHRKISWTGAAGVFDLKSHKQLTGHEPVRIASVTKSFVATAVLRLWEDGRIALEDPITKYISTAHTAILRAGGYVPEEITLRHLLTHTSGLFDHGSSAEYMLRVFDDPQYSWTRTEQLQGAMMWGRPVGKPGDRYSYSDTGYILLGEVIEKVTGKPLGYALRELIRYHAIDLDQTWFEITEQPPSEVPPRAHQYLDTTDTYDFNASIDLYGGGGIVTTMEDLTDFYRALFTGKVFRKKSTLETMLAQVPKNYKEIDEMDYRMGIFRQEVLGYETYTHSGFWGVQVWYIPDLETAVAIAVVKQDDFGVVKRVIERVVAGMTK